MPLLDRLVKMAETITSLIKNKTETVTLFSNYNQELEENKIEIILILANESPEKRATLIRTLFTDIIKQTHKETYVQKHLVSFFRLIFLVSEINYFIVQKCNSQLLPTFDERTCYMFGCRGNIKPSLTSL